MAAPSLDYAHYLNDPRFSRNLELPPNPATGRDRVFRIKYADYGYRNEEDAGQEQVFLFFGPLVGSRLVHVAKDGLAKKHKIRIIHPDRPGIGGTDPVHDVKQIMDLWRVTRKISEAILALLDHLGIRSVSIGCHSGGVISALDILVHHPEILHPERPYVAIGAPWILPKHTGSTSLSIAQALPAGLIGSTDKLARLINNHIGPLLGVSFGISLGLAAKLMPSSSAPREAPQPAPPPPPQPRVERSDESGEESVDGAELERKLWPHVIDRIYAEGVGGMSSDAMLFLQKGMPAGWGDWGDCDTAVQRLAAAAAAASRQQLRVDVFYAERDALIGSGRSARGPNWFDSCWEGVGSSSVQYSSRIVKGANHNEVWDMKWDAVYGVFERIGAIGMETRGEGQRE